VLHEHIIYEIASRSNIEIDLILEPCQRNTAAAFLAGSLLVEKKTDSLRNKQSSIAVFCPSDHHISDIKVYRNIILKAANLVKERDIITLGIKPTFASSSYGYLLSNESPDNNSAYLIDKFIEKPNKLKALSLIKRKNIFWNSGNFIADITCIINASKKFIPEVFSSVTKSQSPIDVKQQNRFLLQKEAFRKCPEISFDKGIMESYDRVKMLPLETNWSDVGSWKALSKLFLEDTDGNRKRGNAHFFKSKGNFVYSTGRPIVTLGIENSVIVESPDIVYVADITSAEELKDAVKVLEREKFDQALNHRQVNRPWGYFDSIEKGERFQVKKITVKSGGRLSLQRHKKRAEHWVVVKGKALVTRGTETFELGENESTFIPIGVKHRLENPFLEPVEIIEVQSGSYLGEDDIERFEDMYGRGTKNG
jgi:mannose-1-phosphate guanylyltransferase/mannose-6-phosphate isomerase